ncbi:MAG: quercetin dioxygenase-like cupin family protein [Arenicella sp.]|jgi:quercetin dioxygenase-like cupin family protein
MTDSNSIQKSLINIPWVSNDGAGPSIFTTRKVALSGLSDRVLSEQIQAINFRLRASDQYYASEWHVARDPTLLIVLTGTIRIELRGGESQEFSNGQMFIA